MKKMSVVVFFLFFLTTCAKFNNTKEAFSLQNMKGYYSDYFVFIADDGGSPLVVPIDINWSLFENGYAPEFKGWYGTEEDWPIAYFKDEVAAKSSDLPNEAFEHLDNENFTFDSKRKSIICNIAGAPEIKIQIPGQHLWSRPDMKSDFPTYAFRAEVSIDDKIRSGWMLYERIRFKAERKFEGFEAFFWMPIVVDSNLYHFTQHSGEQTAVRWSMEQGVTEAVVLPEYSFIILESISDVKSERAKIPKTVQLKVPEWQLDIILKSGGEQVGYGEPYPKGLAYFRQSLLQSTPPSENSGYGMMELILAND